MGDFSIAGNRWGRKTPPSTFKAIPAERMRIGLCCHRGAELDRRLLRRRTFWVLAENLERAGVATKSGYTAQEREIEELLLDDKNREAERL